MERNNIALHKHLEKKDNIIKYNNSLKAPYEYFKKLNILPVSLVEGEMDKYFTFDKLLFEDFKDYNCIGNKNYSWPYTWLCPYFYKILYDSVKQYFNYNDAKIEYCESKNIPQELISVYNFTRYFSDITDLWKIFSENIKEQFKDDLIYNYDTNISRLNNTIKDLQDKQKGYIKAQKYLIPLDKIPPYSQLEIEYNTDSYSRYSEIIIIKVCDKIIKYIEEQYGYNTIEEQLNSLTRKLRQVKKDRLKNELENNLYKLKDYDSNKYYVYVNGEVKLEE